jgi:hypothetical protein
MATRQNEERIAKLWTKQHEREIEEQLSQNEELREHKFFKERYADEILTDNASIDQYRQCKDCITLMLRLSGNRKERGHSDGKRKKF